MRQYRVSEDARTESKRPRQNRGGDHDAFVPRPSKASTMAPVSVRMRTAVLICTVPRYCWNARWVVTLTASIERTKNYDTRDPKRTVPAP